MKKMLRSILCVTLILAILFICSLDVFAVTYVYNVDYPVFNPNSSTTYFTNLYTNFGRNEAGSCAYVASAMLLSYYDSFWSDSFINEQYDVSGSYTYDEDNETIIMGNSPGISMEPHYDSLTNSYNELVELYNDEYFQLFLIELQSELYYVGEDANDHSLKIRLEFYDTYFLLIYYLFIQRSFDSSQIQINKMTIIDGDSPEDIRSQLIENVCNGIPTMYFGSNYIDANNNGIIEENEISRHVMVGYDYDSTTNNIYYHTGWEETEQSSRIVPDVFNEYDNIYGIIWFDLFPDNFAHSCSNNYNDIDSSQSFCMCKFAFHPQHTHTLNNEYMQYTSTVHKRGCSYCNNYVEEAHSAQQYTPLDKISHTITCYCGRTSTGVHVVKSGSNTCLLCRGAVGNGYIHLGVKPIPEPTMELTCDISYIDDEGIIILSEVDYQLFISGEININDIYQKVGLHYD